MSHTKISSKIFLNFFLAVNDYLEGCASPWIKCDVEFCQGDAECEAAFEAASNGAKKGTRQFRTTQALVFGVGIFLGKFCTLRNFFLFAIFRPC